MPCICEWLRHSLWKDWNTGLQSWNHTWLHTASRTFPSRWTNHTLCTFPRTEGAALPQLQRWSDSRTDTQPCSLHPSSRLRRAQALCLPLARLMPCPLRYTKGGCQSCNNFLLEAVFRRLCLASPFRRGPARLRVNGGIPGSPDSRIAALQHRHPQYLLPPLLPVGQLLVASCSARRSFASSCRGAQGCCSALGCGPLSVFFGSKTGLQESFSPHILFPPSQLQLATPSFVPTQLLTKPPHSARLLKCPAVNWGTRRERSGGNGLSGACGNGCSHPCCGAKRLWSCTPAVYTDKRGALAPCSSVFPLRRWEVWSSRVAAPTFQCLHLLFWALLLIPVSKPDLLLLKLGEDQAGQDSRNETLSSWELQLRLRQNLKPWRYAIVHEF